MTELIVTLPLPLPELVMVPVWLTVAVASVMRLELLELLFFSVRLPVPVMPELVEKAKEIYSLLKKEFGATMFDDNGNIGKRYRRQDEIGTPWCIVVDFDTLNDDTVTVRDRDTGEQTRIKVADLKKYIQERIK
jgi:histidyl-tRNA synthetase